MPSKKMFPILLCVILCVARSEAQVSLKEKGRVVLDQRSFPEGSQALPAHGRGPGDSSRSLRISSLSDVWHYEAKPRAKSALNGLPSAYTLRSSKGRLLLVPEVENFEMRFAASSLNRPCVELRWRDDRLHYQLDLAQGVLRKISGENEVILAKASSPWFEESAGKESWSAFQVLLNGGQIRVQVARDGKTWEAALQCVDEKPIASGALLLSTGKPVKGNFVAFGDLEVASLPGKTRGQSLPATGPAYREALLTTMESLARDPHSKHALARIEAMDVLGNVAAPVPEEVATALAVAECDRDLGVRLAALRAIDKLQLKIDGPQRFMDALTSENATVRVGAVRGLIQLKTPPEQLQSKVVDGLMKDSRFARFDVRRLFAAMGEPLRAAVFSEIQTRYQRATDPRVKAALLRALGRDSAEEKPLVQGLALLGDALTDPSAEVRLAAAKSLRWIDSPLAWKGGVSGPGSVFGGQPEETARLAGLLQGMLRSDASVACRVEAVGCLAEMRRMPELVVEALSDPERAVREAAVEALVSYERKKIAGAEDRLQALLKDAELRDRAAAALAFIRDDVLKTAAGGNGGNVLVEARSPQEKVREVGVRAQRAAELSIAVHAERVPVPNDLLSHFSAQLCLRRNRVAANERIQQELQRFSFGDKEGLDGTKLPLIYALHHRKSRYLPGGLSAETEALFKESMFSMVDWSSKAYFDDFVGDVMKLPGTENQSLQYRYGLWFMELALLNEDPAYASRRLRGGKTVAESYAQWNAFLKEWMRTRALNGFWIELGSGYSGKYSLPAIFAIYMAATDPETRQLTKMFIDLAFLEDAQVSFGGVRGGSRNRVKDQGIYGVFGLFWDLLYAGKTVDGKGCHALATSVAYGGYQLPPAVVQMRAFEQFPSQPVLISNRRLGEVRHASNEKSGETDVLRSAEQLQSVSKAQAPSDDDAATPTNEGYVAESRVVNYVWKTRHCMLGSMLRQPKTTLGLLCTQRPWNGLVFANGKGLFPACPWNAPYFSFQHRNVLLLQRDKTDREPMSVLFSPELEKIEENGWVFVRSEDGYAGVRVLAGGYSWRKGNDLALVPEKHDAPILIHAGDKDSAGSFEQFREQLQKNILQIHPDGVEYRGASQPRIEFFYEATGRSPQVDGEVFQIDSAMPYSGPFMQRKAGESVVRVTVGDHRVAYDFEKATVTAIPQKR